MTSGPLNKVVMKMEKLAPLTDQRTGNPGTPHSCLLGYDNM